MKPCIWDISSDDYKNRDKKIQDWLEVAAAVSENWDELNQKEKYDFGK